MIAIKPFNPHLQFHLLRHFEKPSGRYMSQLSKQLNIPVADLFEQTKLIASNFKNEFANNPLDLYQRINETTQQQWKIINSDAGKTDYLILFKKEKWKNGIGEDSVIPVNELNDDEKKNIRYEPKENYEIQTLVVKELPVTFKMVLVVDELGQVITAFPGRWLPPLDKKIIKDWVFLRKK
jgi:hypothetical protein